MKDPILNCYPAVDQLFNALADLIVKTANKAIKERGEFTFALSGGNSPRKLYELLSSSSYRDQIDWTKVYFFFGDERYVPSNDPESNALMAKETLFDRLPIPETNIYRVNTSFSPEQAAQSYAEVLEAHFGERTMQFDLILLGLGNDSHTASLFPYSSILADMDSTVKAVYVQELNTYRITFTAPLINRANHIVFLVYGKDKAEAVKHVFGEVHDSEKYPAQLIHPNHGQIYWFMDEDAATF